MKTNEIKDLVALVKTAAAEAANFQSRFAAEDTEASKIVEIMENFLKSSGRVVYGGAAINAYLSPKSKFYDPRLYLPDYDFMTPDPLQDCADLITIFQGEGFQDVEAKLGIHEGTYKIFVNYRPAADITYMPRLLYDRTLADSSIIDEIRYASPDFLRMNIYVELSRPAGNVSRWEKVYERLLLLNKERPLRPGRCRPPSLPIKPDQIYMQIVTVGKKTGAIFLTLETTNSVILMIAEEPQKIVDELSQLKTRSFEALGELLPARTELLKKSGKLVAVVFQSVACDAYTNEAGLKLGSLDLLIHTYYGLHFAGLDQYMHRRILCVIQDLINLEATKRKGALTGKEHDVFPLECVGHQPTLPELKRAHRKRIEAKKKELATLFQPTRKTLD